MHHLIICQISPLVRYEKNPYIFSPKKKKKIPTHVHTLHPYHFEFKLKYLKHFGWYHTSFISSILILVLHVIENLFGSATTYYIHYMTIAHLKRDSCFISTMLLWGEGGGQRPKFKSPEKISHKYTLKLG